MENNFSSHIQSEDTSVDGLEFVRSINKYLRKALKKIEAIQTASDRLQQNEIEEPISAIQNNLSESNKYDCIHYENFNELVNTSNNASISKTNENIGLVQHRTDNENTGEKSHSEMPSVEKQDNTNESIENIVPSPEIEIVEIDDSNIEDQEGDFENDNESAHTSNFSDISEAPLRQVKCTQSKFHWPIPQAQPSMVKPISLFYKAFIYNLPKSATVSKLKTWLENKGIRNHEDIFIFTKQSYKTSIISFSNKSSRDHLLQIDGQLFHGEELKIRVYVNQNAPETDKLPDKHHQKSQNSKKPKHR